MIEPADKEIVEEYSVPVYTCTHDDIHVHVKFFTTFKYQVWSDGTYTYTYYQDKSMQCYVPIKDPRIINDQIVYIGNIEYSLSFDPNLGLKGGFMAYPIPVSPLIEPDSKNRIEDEARRLNNSNTQEHTYSPVETYKGICRSCKGRGWNVNPGVSCDSCYGTGEEKCTTSMQLIS